MKLEIKLENPKYCTGCYALWKLRDYDCLHYKISLKDDETGSHKIRPEFCIKANEDTWIRKSVLLEAIIFTLKIIDPALIIIDKNKTPKP